MKNLVLNPNFTQDEVKNLLKELIQENYPYLGEEQVEAKSVFYIEENKEQLKNSEIQDKLWQEDQLIIGPFIAFAVDCSNDTNEVFDVVMDLKG